MVGFNHGFIRGFPMGSHGCWSMGYLQVISRTWAPQPRRNALRGKKPRWKNGAGLWSEAQRIYRIHILYMYVFIRINVIYIYVCILFFGGELGACLNPGSQWVNLRIYSFLWREPVFNLHWLHCFGRAEGMFIPTFTVKRLILMVDLSTYIYCTSRYPKSPEFWATTLRWKQLDQRKTKDGLVVWRRLSFLSFRGNVFFLGSFEIRFFCPVVAVIGIISTICNSTIT